jgi:hypothetical protein
MDCMLVIMGRTGYNGWMDGWGVWRGIRGRVWAELKGHFVRGLWGTMNCFFVFFCLGIMRCSGLCNGDWGGTRHNG